MDRRHFLATAAGSAGLLKRPLGDKAHPNDKPAHDTASAADHGNLAGLSLPQLRGQYRSDLFGDFLPFMDKYVIDHKYGGFMCATDRDGTNINQNKRTWDEGRGIWAYSFLYNNLARQEQYLEIARKSVGFILKAKPSDPDALWPGAFTREGKPLTGPDTSIYGDLFIAQGLAEYSKATRDQQYWDFACKIIDKCVRVYDRADYDPDVGQGYLGPSAPPFPGARVQVNWLVLLHILTQMLEMQKDPKLETLSNRCVDALLNYHYNPDYRLMGDFLNHDLSRPTNEYGQVVHFGAAIEALWMLLYEAARLKDKALFNTVGERFKRHVEVASDQVYGGIFEILRNVDTNIWTLHKYSLVQEEVLIGALSIAEHTGAPWAKQMFAQMSIYVRDKFPLKKYGYPLWILKADRKVTFERHSDRVENYRHPRHLMYNLLSIDRMVKRGGKVANLFA